MSLALSAVVMCGSSQPNRRSQPAAYAFARLTMACSAALFAGS